ncbi:hypothetical protein QFZ44_000769 [Pantoea agglomerans]|nr:hypothetical protein [Pantoea agglomerans]
MSVKNENAAGGESVVLERPAAGGVYASLFKKINLNPVSELSALDIWQDAQAMSAHKSRGLPAPPARRKPWKLTLPVSRRCSPHG